MATESSNPKQKRSGGLQGKARQNKVRNRAWRLHSQQMIEEFVDPKTNLKGGRQIPVKRRGEFTPSAPVMGSKYGVGTEQELELVYSTENDDEVSDTGLFDDAFALVSPEASEESAITFSAPTNAAQREKENASVEPDERQALFADRQNKATPVGIEARAEDDFTVGGFAIGCAMGTAAAAVLLMMVRVTFL